MKRRRVILIAVACLVAVVIAFVVWPAEREPEYQGKKLSEWLVSTGGIDQNTGLPIPDNGAEEAIQRIGTNALPLLLKWICYREPPWKAKAYAASKSLPSWLGKRYFGDLFSPPPDPPYEVALRGFSLLGAKAGPAVPALTELAKDSRRPHVVWIAMIGLSRVGDPGVAEILRLLDEPDSTVRGCATNVLPRIPPEVLRKARAARLAEKSGGQNQ